MRPTRLALLTALPLALAACGSSTDGGKQEAAAPKVAAPAGKAWSDTVVATPEGGFRMGNPEAPLKVVEFGSYTCHVCAQFAEESKGKIASEFVNSGQVSFEFRSFLRNPLDAMAGAIIGCAGPERAFALTESTMADQAGLMAGAQANGAAAEGIAKLPEAERFPALAKAWGIDTFYQSRGVPAATINSCLADMKNLTAQETATNDAIDNFKIQGTPTFVLNGVPMNGVITWAQFRDQLRSAGAR